MVESGKDYPTMPIKHATGSIKMIMDFIHCVSGTIEFFPQDIIGENRSRKLLAPSHETCLPKSTLRNTNQIRNQTQNQCAKTRTTDPLRISNNHRACMVTPNI